MDDGPRNNGEKTPKREMPEGVRFQAGNPGRPKGSRNKLGEDFLKALHEDFSEHGVKAIQDMRAEDPAAYVKVVASLLPKEIKVSTAQDLSDDELDRRIRQLAAALSLELGGDAGIGGTAGREEAPARPN